MSTLLVPWLLFPIVLVALSWGCGLLLERAAGMSLPGALVVPCGFAVVALVAQFAVLTDATAELATPAVVVAAAAGFVLARPWRSLHVDGWAIGSWVAAFAAYAAPIVLSGAATFAGYIKLDDDSTLLALVDRAMEHGRDVTGLDFSTYLRVVDLLLDEGYPLASLLPIGVGREIVRGDSLWLYQPAMAVMAAMLALGLYQLAGSVVQVRWQRAVAAVVGAQSALLFGYALWGGIKELGTAWALPVLAALVPLAARSVQLRHLIPLAAVSALLLGVLNAGAIVWLAPALGMCLVLVVRERGLARGGAPDRGLPRLPRRLRAADDRRRPRVPHVEHRQLRPDREPRSAAQPDPGGGHLAGRRLPCRSGARRCDEGADRHRRGGGGARGRVDDSPSDLGTAPVRDRRRGGRCGALDLEHALDRGQGVRHRRAGHSVRGDRGGRIARAIAGAWSRAPCWAWS